MEDIGLTSSPSERERGAIENHFSAAKGILDNDVLPFLLEIEGKAKIEEFSTTYFVDKHRREISNNQKSELFGSNEKIIANTHKGVEVLIPQNTAYMFEKAVKIPTFNFKDKSKEKYMEVKFRDYNPAYFVFDLEKEKQIELSRRNQFNKYTQRESAFDKGTPFNQIEGISINYDGYKWIYHKSIDSEGKNSISMSFWWFDEDSGELKPLKTNIPTPAISGENFDKLRRLIGERVLPKTA